MIPARIDLASPTRDDVERIGRWLQDDEINGLWFGRFPDGEPIHLGYIPSRVLAAPQEEWDRVFLDPHRQIFAVHSRAHGHIGEAQLVVEEPLRNAELAVLIGRKDVWSQGYGTAILRELLRLAFEVHGLGRTWVDIPDYNPAALRVCQKLGFVEEGRLRKSRPRGHERLDSVIMGMILQDYRRLLEREAHVSDF